MGVPFETGRMPGGAVTAVCGRCGETQLLVLMTIIDDAAYCRGGECGSWVPEFWSGDWAVMDMDQRRAMLAEANAHSAEVSVL